MKKTTALAAIAVASALGLSACADTNDAATDTTVTSESVAVETSTEESSEETTTEEADPHAGHAMHGGPAPEGIAEAEDPTYAVGTEVTVLADHMPGMEGATATISGAYDTTAYSVSYQPTDGGEEVTDHRWVVHEELENPGEAPLADGTPITIQAQHMAGMDGAEGTVDYAAQETVYMIDIEEGDVHMTNHKWVTESELQPAE